MASKIFLSGNEPRSQCLIFNVIFYFLDTFYVGPILPRPPNALSKDLEKVMQSSGKEGVVVVSFGSELSVLPEHILKTMASAFGKLKQTVIWKMKSMLSAYMLNFCSLVWSGLVWSGLVWSGLVWSGLVWSGLVWSGLVWSGLVWSGLVWSGLVWSGLVWSGLVDP